MARIRSPVSDDDRNARQLRVVATRAGELEAVHAGHAQVGEHDAGCEPSRSRSQRLRAVDRDRDPVAGLLERVDVERANARVVVDHEHRVALHPAPH